ncbi:MAG: glycosyltransferase [Desulfurobacteriaceae bacterium]
MLENSFSENFIIITVIPTINRPDKLKRSVNSVLMQKYFPNEILVVYEKYKSNYQEVEKVVFDFQRFGKTKVSLIPNVKTNNLSGNINTAILYIKNKYKGLTDRITDRIFVSILDDDDEYLPDYIQTCVNEIKKNTNIVAVFSPIKWKTKDGSWVNYIKKENLTPREFFIGNPGVQGSNMFIKFGILEKIGGFDEKLISTTDRDLMIRFLRFVESYNKKNNEQMYIKVLDKSLVIYHAEEEHDRLTTNKFKKVLGLNAFYRKYRSDFSQEDFKKSLERSRKLFGYEYINRKGKIVIGMPFKDNFKTVEKAVRSVLKQKSLSRELILLIINEGSYNDLKREISSYLDDPRLIIHSTNIGKISAIRNYIIDFAIDAIPDVEYIGRLDADDWLVDDYVLSRLEKIMDKYSPDVIIAGNKLAIDGKVIDRINYADKRLLDFSFLEKKNCVR